MCLLCLELCRAPCPTTRCFHAAAVHGRHNGRLATAGAVGGAPLTVCLLRRVQGHCVVHLGAHALHKLASLLHGIAARRGGPQRCQCIHETIVCRVQHMDGTALCSSTCRAMYVWTPPSPFAHWHCPPVCYVFQACTSTCAPLPPRTHRRVLVGGDADDAHTGVLLLQLSQVLRGTCKVEDGRAGQNQRGADAVDGGPIGARAVLRQLYCAHVGQELTKPEQTAEHTADKCTCSRPSPIPEKHMCVVEGGKLPGLWLLPHRMCVHVHA